MSTKEWKISEDTTPHISTKTRKTKTRKNLNSVCFIRISVPKISKSMSQSDLSAVKVEVVGSQSTAVELHSSDYVGLVCCGKPDFKSPWHVDDSLDIHINNEDDVYLFVQQRGNTLKNLPSLLFDVIDQCPKFLPTFLESNLFVDSLNAECQTPLEYAILCKDIESVKVLLSYGLGLIRVSICVRY
ncbi:hypothetical protein BC833DRAFT_607874 [Globomyces pollinis-pini]|nr:hypothetical protein BC833DRAFT_607874 [Globomyces pollinis-pini]